MGQSKRVSFIEACGNTAVGYGINLVVQMVVFPLFGMHISFQQNIEIGLIFTGISIARGYILRRVFETYRR